MLFQGVNILKIYLKFFERNDINCEKNTFYIEYVY